MGIILTFIFLVIFVIQVADLIQKRQWKEIVVVSVLLLLGALYSLGQIYDWPLPNPNRRMELLIEPVYKMLENILS